MCLAIFALVFLTHCLSPNATPFDSRWTVYTAQSLLHEGNADLNEFHPALREQDYYAIECVGPDYKRTYPVDFAAPCVGMRFYNFYPVAVPTLAAPVVFVLERTIAVLQPWLAPIAERMPTEVRRAFLKGDLIRSSAFVEILVASLIIALAAVVMYGMAREVVSPARALIAAFVFAFCTSAWSTGSRALWQHGPSMLLIGIAVWLALVARRRPEVVQYIGAPLMLALFVRPTNIVPLAGFTVFVWICFRRSFVRFALWAAPIAIGFCLASDVTYGTILAPYAFAKRVNAPGLGVHPEMWAAFTGNMISPARGLLVFTPIVLLCLYGLFRRASDPYERALKALMIAIIGGHWLLITLYEDWWGGHSFGPRYFSDLTPVFVYLLTPSIALLFRRSQGKHTVAFVALAAISFFIHLRGATAWATMEWNMSPSIRDYPGRIWDWRDLQFLRGLGDSPGSPEPAPARVAE
ncbi:MAG TPA: hypothetical protein VER03_22875 [Bryobacteraceae bacterium]|nr:hypothetical protein [Bryobacteraceae bacterium]